LKRRGVQLQSSKEVLKGENKNTSVDIPGYNILNLMSILPHKYAEEKISVDKVSMARLNVGCSTGC
jgi:hypothetical protein